MRKRIYGCICIMLVFLIVLPMLASCSGMGYYDDEKLKRSSKLNIGEYDMLTYAEQDGLKILENEHVRMVLNGNGSIREYANKDVDLYLTKDAVDATPVRIDKKQEYAIDSYSYYTFEVVENSTQNKTLKFTYFFDPVTVITTVSLVDNSDEVVFRLALEGNEYSDTVIDVEYPIVENIKTLDTPEKDYFVCPYATGFSFNNPVKYFNEGTGGIGKSMGLYPSGWYYTMQFATYYSQGIGGFYWTTRDSADGIKSFSFTGDDGDLRMSMYHYLDSMDDGDTSFDYDFAICNMNQGNWYEAAERYKDWAVQQDSLPEKLTERTDIDKKLYEQTTLAIFGYRADITGWKDMVSIYDMIASQIDNNILNVSIYNVKKYYDLVREYGHTYIPFEFNSISDLEEYRSNKMINVRDMDQIFSVNGIPFYYQCPYNEKWLEYRIEVDEGYLAQFDADGFYYDVAFTAVHPIQCFNETHDHKALTNMLPYFYKQLKNSDTQAEQAGVYTVGTEMLTEKTIQYIDFYQARANAGLVGWMETDSIRPLLENGCAVKIPLFDYIYHEYGAVRVDGYLMPLDEIGQAYYNIVSYTVLNGGIPEYNPEYYPDDKIPSSSMINIDMVQYLNKISNIRATFGKDYLVYGQMVRSPDVGTGSAEYEYFNSNIRPTCDTPYIGGTTVLDDVVVSAYKKNDGTVAVFLSNVTEKSIDCKFILHALRDYGIQSGQIRVTDTQGKTWNLTSFDNGDVGINLTLDAREAYMLEIIQ